MLALNQGGLYRTGVNIVTGKDAIAPDVRFGEAVHQKMQLLVNAGMSTMDTIIGNTAGGGTNLGRQDDLGTVERGKPADLVAVEGDPRKDVAESRNVKLAVSGGDIVVDRLT